MAAGVVAVVSVIDGFLCGGRGSGYHNYKKYYDQAEPSHKTGVGRQGGWEVIPY